MNKNWNEKWNEDIDFLKKELKRKHKNLFAYTNEESFNNKIQELKQIINQLDYEEIKVEIAKIIASLKDAHTFMIFPARKFLPLKFYYFEDGIYIIDTTKKYENLLFKKVLAIEDIAISEVLKDISKIVSFENEALFKAQSMKYLQIAEALYGLLIIDDIDTVKISLEDDNYYIKTCSSEALLYTNTKLPLYALNSSINLWFKLLNTNKLYIKYNSCKESSTELLSSKFKKIIQLIEEKNITTITIDFRNNLGGNSTLFEPFINYLKEKKPLNLKIIIGRETFSSALLNVYNLKMNTNAKIIGEPSGGKPNCYGEVLKFTLPNSKFIISYSTKFYRLIDDDSILSLYPDELKVESITDYTKEYTIL
ncbi:MAG: peptidase S41 [Sarcina sp.]